MKTCRGYESVAGEDQYPIYIVLLLVPGAVALITVRGFCILCRSYWSQYSLLGMLRSIEAILPR